MEKNLYIQFLVPAISQENSTNLSNSNIHLGIQITGEDIDRQMVFDFFCWVEFLRIPKFLIVGNNLLLLVSNFIAIFSVTENNKCYHLDFCPIFFTCVFETVSDFITLIIFVTFIIRLIQEKKSKIKRYLQMFWFLVFYELSHNSKITIVSNILLISVYVLYTYL